MIVVVEKKATPEDSIYRYGTGRKDLSHPQLHNKLTSRGEPVVSALESIRQAWEESIEVESGQVEVTELNEETRELLKFFRWSADKGGAVSCFCKSDLNREVYIHSSNLLASALRITPTGMEETIYSWMHRKFTKLVRKRSLSFFGAVLGGKTSFPPLTFYWEKWARGVWEEDPYFQLRDTPQGISDDPTVPCFYFFNAKHLQPGPTDYWDGWMQIIPEPLRPVFRAWVYSVFIPGNTGRQALWLHDNGYTGKTSVINAIAKYLGEDASGAISAGSLKSGFAYETIYGKRLITYGDCSEPNLIKTSKVHSILGNDVVVINQKNMKPFPARLHCKLLIASNIAPYINNLANNERTRILYIPLLKPTEDQQKKYSKLDKDGNIMRLDNGEPIVIGGNLTEELLSQMEAFLFSCQGDYHTLCSNGQDIQITQEHADLIEHHCVGEEELTFRSICTQVFHFSDDPLKHPLPLELVQQAYNVTTCGEAYSQRGNSNFGRFKKYIVDRYGVRITKGGSLNKQLCHGIQLNPSGGTIRKLETYLKQKDINVYIVNEEEDEDE